MEYSFNCLNNYWDAVVSLGGSCQVSYQLNRLGLRGNSYPFDWLFSFNSELLIEAINNSFSSWLKLENLQEDKSRAGEHRFVTDVQYDMVHQHIFPLGISMEEGYPQVKKTVDRRIDRFLSLKGKRVLFIRTNTSKEHAESLSDVLVEKIGGGVYLLVLNHSRDFHIQEIAKLERAAIYSIYDENEGKPGDRWQGYDPHWNSILQNTRLNCIHVSLADELIFENFHQYEGNGKKGFRWTKKESIIHLEQFGGQQCCISYHSNLPVHVAFLDSHNKVMMEKEIEENKQYEFNFCINHDSRWIKVLTPNAWRPCVFFNSQDRRELGVAITDVTVNREKVGF